MPVVSDGAGCLMADAADRLERARQFQRDRDWPRAEELCRQILAEAPDHAEAHYALGQILLGQGRFADAALHLQEALRLNRDHVDAHNNLGITFVERGLPEYALACYDQALRLKPDFAGAHYNRGIALMALGRRDEALPCYQEAIRLKPDLTGAFNNRGNLYKDQGRVEEALPCYRRVLAVRPDDWAATSNLLLALLYHPGLDAGAVAAEHFGFGERLQSAVAAGPPHPPGRDPGKRLRVGYVSADFREHVMGYFAELVVGAHDRGRVEVVCYANHPGGDGRTDRIRDRADRWVSLAGVPDAEAAERVRADGIDLLVDLSGHTGGNRLPVFARRPAPVQATLYGYPATTGLRSVDYHITDAYQDPPGMTERYYSEELVRLPDAWACFAPATAVEVGELPARRARCVTFGSNNNLAKVTAPSVALWAEVLLRVPNSRMLVVGGMGREADGRLLELFALNGVESRRVTLVGRRPRADYYKLYQEIDVILDPFPFSGCNTTCDALWMGVPVVTLPGAASASRQGVALLALAGLSETIAGTPAAYVAAAAQLAGDLDRLAELRAGLRGRLAASPVLDVARYARNLEDAYRRMWERSCGRREG